MSKNIVSFWCKKPVRVVPVKIGEIYAYEPINPAATRNRGRQCVLLAHNTDPFLSNPEQNAQVQWLDTKRKGLIDIQNLIHIDQITKSAEELINETVDYIKQGEKL